MPTRRQFLGALGLPSIAVYTGLRHDNATIDSVVERIHARWGDDDTNAVEFAQDETYWAEVARAFTVDRSLLNLNNGGVSPAPAFVQDAMKGHLDYSNKCPTYTMWRILQPQKEMVREKLARTFGCDKEEVAITRNASESLQICQFGFDLARGDEVLCTNQDYPRMVTTFKQRERREGIVLKQFPIPTPCDDPAAIVELYRKHITARTKLILVCHVINITGQILPVSEITKLGRERGIPVIVDGAHALAHVDFQLADLDVDYYASSLHKWLFAPHGTGFLYVRRDKIEGLWPLMAAPETKVADIRKFEEIGTHPLANFLAIAEALTFHHGIGAARKEARFLYLRDYWAKRLGQNERVRLHTSLRPGSASGIANVEIDGVDSLAISSHLFSEHRIVTTMIKHEDCPGLRISPSVYTTLGELDRFCDIMMKIARDGLPT